MVTDMVLTVMINSYEKWQTSNHIESKPLKLINKNVAWLITSWICPHNTFGENCTILRTSKIYDNFVTAPKMDLEILPQIASVPLTTLVILTT